MAHRPYLVGLVGTGVGPSLTPALHMAEAAAQGLDYVYRTIDLNEVGLAPEQIGEVLDWARALGFDALNVTYPCKHLVIEHLDDVDDVAAELGAVNTVVFDGARAVGYNTDTTGFALGFAEGLPWRGDRQRRTDRGGRCGCRRRRRAAAPRRRPPDRRRRRRRTRHRTRPRTGRHAARSAGRRVVARQARGAAARQRRRRARHPHRHGRRTRACRSTPNCCIPGMWVADIVYRPLDTALLSAARAAGCRTSRRRTHGRAPGRQGLRFDHRRHPGCRPHVATLPPPRRLTNHHRERN